MKIVIKDQIVIKDKDQKIDDDFDVNGWISLRVEEKEIDIHISDLYPAVVAFMEKYKLTI